MKTTILLGFCSFFTSLTLTAQQLIPFRYAQKWGYINEKREVVIQPQFEEADFFNGNIARVRNNRKYGVIDKTGKIIHECQYVLTDYFADGYMKIRRERKENGKELREEFLLNRNGKILNSNKPLENINYNDACVIGKDFQTNKYHIFDTNFVEIVSGGFDYASPFKGNVASVKIGEKYTLIDRSGNQFFAPIDGMCYVLSENFAAYYANNGYNIIDTKGNLITWVSYYPMSDDGILIIKQQLGKTLVTDLSGKKILETDKKLKPLNGKYLLFTDAVSQKIGVIDLKGNVLIKAIYDGVLSEQKDIFIVSDSNGKVGVVGKKGETILPFEFYTITFHDNFLKTYKSQSAPLCVYNLNGKRLTDENCKYHFGDIGSKLPKENKSFIFVNINNQLELLDSTGTFYREDILSASTPKPQGTQIRRYRNADGKWGFINEFNEVVVPYQYEAVEVINDGIMPAKKNGKWGYVTEKGVEIVPCEYDEAIYFVKGFGRLKKGGKWGMVNTSGKFVVELKYDEVGYMEGGNLFGTINGVRNIITTTGNTIDSYSTSPKSNSSTSGSSSSSPKTYCVSFIMTKQSRVYLYMVQVTDNTGSASESRIIQAARELKNQKIWNGYYESNVLVDTKDCMKAKELANQSGFRYDDFQVDYTTIK